MYEKNDNRYNCSESVILFVNDEIPLEGFGKGVMRANSNLGGGGAGWGSLCGAVNGGCQVFGLLMGTNGDEPFKEFKAKREKMRDKTQVYLKAFEEKWETSTASTFWESTRGPRRARRSTRRTEKGNILLRGLCQVVISKDNRAC